MNDSITRHGGDAGRRRVIVLGASNVSRGLPRLTAAMRMRSRDPIDLFAAAGHGRSYGANSRVWLRRLPSILWCGLWRALDRDAAPGPGTDPRSCALITDVGNDLLYGFSVAQVADWVREAARRLAAREAAIVMTRLPLASIDGVGWIRYRLLRTLYVPGCTLSLAEMKDSAVRLDAAMIEIATEFKATLIDQPGDWYGLDAIHLQRPCLDTLWQRVCDAWELPAATARSRASFQEWMAIGRRAAEVRMLSGRMRYTRQPVIERHGLRVSMY